MRITDLSIGAVIFIGPHLLGGRHLLGRFVIVAFCVAAAVTWALGHCLDPSSRWKRTGGLTILLLAIGLVAFQLVLLPKEWLTTLAPATAEILPLWTNDDARGLNLGEWQTLSLSPEDTRLALATLIAYGLLYVAAVQRLNSIDDVKRIITWIASSALIVAGFGIVQYFTANGKFFWIYEYPYTDTLDGFKAGFTNRNHFAHFLVIGLTCLLGWTMHQRVIKKHGHSSSRSLQRFRPGPVGPGRPSYVLGMQSVAAGVLVFAVLASLSRGAVVAMMAAGLAMAYCYAKAGLLRSKHLLAAVVLGIGMMGTLSLSGDYESVARRLRSFTSASLEDLDQGGGRRTVWSANVAAFKAAWMTGWGAGSHRFVYPLYLTEPVAGEFTHAENGYLQVASENGIGGIVLLLAAAFTSVYWCLSAIHNADKKSQVAALAGGLLAALATSLVHSLADFVWFIPACACVTILLLACAMRLFQLVSPSREPLDRGTSKLSRFNLAGATALAGTWVLVVLYPAALSSLEWDDYVVADNANRDAESRQALTGGSTTHPTAEDEQLNFQSSLVNLFKVVRLHPQSPRAHARLAGALLNHFEMLQRHSDNQMTIGQISEAAEASNFRSPRALREWLVRAFGKNCELLYQAHYHARRAVAHCPLQGEAYVQLSELCFLEGGDGQTANAYGAQALLLRPQDPYVLYTLGQQSLANRDIDRALSLWARAYKSPGKYQYLINAMLVPGITAANFTRIFQPTCLTFSNLWTHYRRKGNQGELNTLLAYAAEQSSKEIPSLSTFYSGMAWWTLASMYRDMGHPPEALECLQKAYVANPYDYGIRYDLGHCLASLKQYELAERHFRWCLAQSPNNESLRGELLNLSRAKMQHVARQTTASKR